MSGTVGMPKGVMLSHDGILSCSHVIKKFLPLLQGSSEISISYLPLSHIAAQLFDFFMSVRVGGLLYFADRNALKGSLLDTCVQSKANILFGVPRVYEKIQEKFEQIEANSSPLTKLLMSTARSIMENYYLDKIANRTPSSLKYWLASKIVYRIKEAMGFNYMKGCCIGGAPVTEEVKKFFLGLDMPLIDVYGMSECSGGMAYNFDNPNLGTVGKANEGVKIKIDSPNENGEGEILVGGRGNLMGYLKEKEKTLELLTDDGFVRTGDMGYLDDEGNVYVIGRKKEIIITAGGENIPPIHIEALIKKELPCISNAMVVGDNRKYLTALLTFKTDFDAETGLPLNTLRPDAVQWLQSLDLNYTHLTDLLNISLPASVKNFDPNTVDINCDAKVWEALEEGVKRYNARAISNAQKIQYFSVLPHDFSLPTGELGPTLKIKRSFVEKKYFKIIEKMYKK